MELYSSNSYRYRIYQIVTDTNIPIYKYAKPAKICSTVRNAAISHIH